MKLYACIALVTAIVASGCQGHSKATPQPLTAAAAKHESEEQIPIDAVPRNVRDAAAAAVPGQVVETAEREIEKGVAVYDLEGKAGGVRVEVEVTADGKVLEVEKGEDRDDNDKGEDKDNDEDDNDDHDGRRI